MAIDPRKLERELARIFRGNGVPTSTFYGVEYIGACSTGVVIDVHGLPEKVTIRSYPEAEVVSLAALAQEIAEVLA